MKSRFLRFGLYLLVGLLAGIGPASAATVIRVGYIPVLGSSALFVLNGEGWARDAGLDLRLVRFQSGPQAIQALVSGKIDAYVAGVLPLLLARAHGADVKVVAAGAIEELEVVARGPLAAGLGTEGAAGPAGDALKQRFDAFSHTAGRKPKIATQPVGSVPDTLLRYWLKQQNGIEPAQVADIVGIDIDAAQQAFLAGAVDAAVLREPALSVVRNRLPESRVLANGHDMMPDQPGSVLAIYHGDDPDRAVWKETLVGLFIRATNLLASRPEAAVPFVQEALGGGILGQAVILQALKSSGSHFVSDPSTIMESVRRLQAFEVASGTLRKAEPVEGLFDLDSYRRAHP
ncbi:ABC transporter substrate-binding protein [Gluconacetobacter tumulisoli]|uniref:ABC transporter substrate-binding protein n=1 Tax=Gluconacetobacter tumulisoli TaxID=1286189 RepID=A0A7W4K4J0_9PROT|nr:ABC transporter substrate-binding protein [Gluconacetobacter tumulisoli]MBB2200226.1 ABC transporter substrate-binding protein [Gluconacetobacter tumulisoli]